MTTIPVLVTTDWLSEQLDDPKLRLLDVTPFLKQEKATLTGKEAYDEGHIPGAVFVDIENELSNPTEELPFTVPSREPFIKKITDLGVGADTYVIIYEQHTSPASYWASRLWWQLRYEGFEHVGVLDGGLSKWIAEGRPLSQLPGSYQKGTWTDQRQPELLVNTDEVKKAIDDESIVFIHSLSSADFKGETNPFARPGHIPGSVNVFYGLHTDSKTNTVSKDEMLQHTFQQVGALDPTKKVITYCGRGIAATWNALLLAKIGVTNVAVYDGSLAEWTADPSLPLETNQAE